VTVHEAPPTHTATTDPSGDRGPARPQASRLPDIPGPGETALTLWRRLRRMLTALVLLFALAAASGVATFVPQEPVIRSTVADWRAGEAGPGAGWARAFDALGLFDVYGSWWFTLLTATLLVSLTGCLIPRWRAFARNVRGRPPTGRNLDWLTNHTVVTTPLGAGEALTAVDGVLARRRFRRRRVGAQVAAERGHWREGGSLVFHTSFYLILLGAVLGQTFGFRGHINLAEGSAFADTRIAYDLAQPGRWWNLDDHRGFVVRLDAFAVSFYDDFTPSDFVSTITILEGGQPVRAEEVRVNHPVRHQGMVIYQARWGMAPRVVLRAGDRVIFDEPLMLSLAEGRGWIWTGVGKVAVGGGGGDGEGGRGPQVALDVVLLPDAALTEDGMPFSRSPEPKNPRLIADLWVGEDLGLDRPVPASQFDRDAGQVVGPPAILAPGESVGMANGALLLEFPDLQTWSGFQVSHAPGRWLLVLGGTLLLAGLIPSLYSYRRRIWAEAHPDATSTRLVLAGVALQRKEAFAEEFTGVAAAVEAAVAHPVLDNQETHG
jgi:cytochrome c biogenesis protein